MQPDDVAAILEKAADLYESEQIDWCRGAWGSPVRSHGDIESGSFGHENGQFHCAEGAILRAAGYTMQDMLDAQVPNNGYPGIDRLTNDPGVKEAFRAVAHHLGHMIDEDEPKLWNLNDRMDAEQPDKAKQYLINVFKETAKDLRNKA